MRDRERERERQAEGEAGSMQGAQCGTRSRVSRIMPWAEGGAKSLSHPGCPQMAFDKGKLWLINSLFKYASVGIPGWHSGLVPAFGPERDPEDLGSNPTSGSPCMEPASLSAMSLPPPPIINK